jgi:conjugal transfer/type IV secretion protein DotA/TraY
MQAARRQWALGGLLLILIAVSLWGLPAWAETNNTLRATVTEAKDVFARTVEQDIADNWLDALFYSLPLPDAGDEQTVLGSVSAAIRQVLRFANVGFMLLAGFLVLYYALMGVVETARSGRYAWGGARTWAPLRFVLVLALLLPVSSGLNLGQHVLIKVARMGSSLASNAWEAALETTNEALRGLVTPRPPDLRPVALRALDIAVCQAVYRGHYAQRRGDEAVRLLGGMDEARRVFPNRLAGERWIFANALHSEPPLCGGYRFETPALSYDAVNNADKLIADLDRTAHATAERLAVQSGALASLMAPAFVQGKTAEEGGGADLFGTIGNFIKEQQAFLEPRVTAATEAQARLADESLVLLSKRGWIAAGTIFWNVMKRQVELGSLADRAVPALDPPLLGHRVLDFMPIVDAMTANRLFRPLPPAQKEQVATFYERANASMREAHQWLYARPVTDSELVPATQLDLGDALTTGSEAARGFALLRRLIDQGFVTFGIWSRAPHDVKTRQDTLMLAKDMTQRPFAALAEIGRRYDAMGAWLMGTMGAQMAQPSVMAAAIVAFGLGGVLALGGFVLLFLVPLIPFVRFTIGVLVWLLAVFEAVASMPLVALASLNPTGEGLVTGAARRASCLWLAVFIRPFLTVFGFLVGWGGFFVGMAFIHALFGILIADLMPVRIDNLTELRVAFSLMYVGLVLILTNVVFRGISFFPERVLDWTGGMIMGASSVPTDMNSVAPVSAVAGGGSFAAASAEGGAAGQSGLASMFGETFRSSEGGRTAAAKAPMARENALFPQYRDKEPPPVVIPKTGLSAAAAAKEGMAAAGARVSREGATAIAVAKASVVMKPATEDIAKLAKQAGQAAHEIKGDIPAAPTKPSSSSAAQETTATETVVEQTDHKEKP